MINLSRSRLYASLQAWLAARAPRERQLMRVAGLLLPLAAAWATFDWTWSEQQRLALRLPAARASFERMQEDAAELARLRTLPPVTAVSSAALVAATSTAAEARGLRVSAAMSAEGVVVKGSATLPALVDWLASIQADLRLRPIRMKTTPGGDGQFEVVLQAYDDAGLNGG